MRMSFHTRRQKSRLRLAMHYLRVAEVDRARFEQLSLDHANIIQAADFFIEMHDWDSLFSLTRALNDYWYRRDWNEYVKYNSILLASQHLEGDRDRENIASRLAGLHELRAEYSEARRLYLYLAGISDLANDSVASLDAMKQALRLARVQGDLAEAQRLYLTVLGKVRALASRKDEVDILHDGAQLYCDLGEVDESLQLCNCGRGIAESLGYWSAFIDVTLFQAAIFVTQERFANALDSVQAALQVAVRAGDHIRSAKAREQRERIQKLMGNQVFISYNHNDRYFVERLANDLKSSGIAVWWAEWEIKVGESIIRKVSEGIEESAYLMVALSPNSVKSNWVQRELGSALMNQLSAERGITVLPLLLADCEIPVLLREVKWADFRSDYQSGLHELLRTLLSE
jgi:hypothetical protein